MTALNPKGQKTEGSNDPFDKWEMKPKTVLIKNEKHYERIPSPETMRLELNYIYDFGHLGGKNYKCKFEKRSSPQRGSYRMSRDRTDKKVMVKVDHQRVLLQFRPKKHFFAWVWKYYFFRSKFKRNP